MKNISIDHIMTISKSCLKCKTIKENKGCVNNCPLNNDIPGILSLIEKGKIEEAKKKLFLNNAMPYLTSLLCNHQNFCYGNCLKKDHVPFYEVEEYLGKTYFDDLITYPNQIIPSKILIIGGGVAGLSVAHFLLKAGLGSTIYDLDGELGGTLKHILPNFRYDMKYFNKHIEAIKKHCLVKQVNVNNELLKESKNKFDIIVITTGNQITYDLNNDESYLDGLMVLRDYNKGKLKINHEKVIVIGGGNTAVDVARSLKRLENDVCICYRRDEASAPLSKEELELAKNEGVIFKECLSPNKLVTKDGISGFSFYRTKLVDNGNTRKDFQITSEEVFIPTDKVVLAIGQRSDYSLIKDLSDDYRIYPCGDFVNGPSSFASAIHSAKEVTEKIIKRQEPVFLFGGSFNPPTIAHTTIIKSLSKLGKVIIVPNGDAYHNKELISYETRVEMIKLIIEDLSNVIISNIEKERPFLGSIQTLKEFNHPIMVIGDDCLVNLEHWIKADQLVSENRFMVFSRFHTQTENKLFVEHDPFLSKYQFHFGFMDDELTKKVHYVSSTNVRIKQDSKQLDVKVLEYIKKYNLYGGK